MIVPLPFLISPEPAILLQLYFLGFDHVHYITECMVQKWHLKQSLEDRFAVVELRLQQIDLPIEVLRNRASPRSSSSIVKLDSDPA